MFYSSQTEVYNLEDSLSDSCEELLCRSMVFGIVLYLVITKEAWQGYIPSRSPEGQISTHVVRGMTLASGKRALSRNESWLGGVHPYLQGERSLLLGNVSFPLMMEAGVPGAVHTDCAGDHTIQAKS